jgi:3'-phosphoadenosine 5'-phosphosulfate sulfotransferase (PAPS reductase)/FAD synthetase
MKHIVLFSGGAASSHMAWLVSKQHDKKDIILLHTPTYSEHPDADRFRKEVSEYIGIPITEQADGRDIWQLIDDEKCIPGYFMPFCTRILKIEQTEKFLKSIKEDFIQYIGYSSNEWKRVQNTTARNLVKGRVLKFPVYECGISDTEIKQIIEKQWKIKLPETYKHLKHNNCIPCFKAGKNEWKKFWLYYPEEFQKAVQKEKETGHTVFKDRTLEELAKIFKNNKDFEGSQISMNIPCMCVMLKGECNDN